LSSTNLPPEGTCSSGGIALLSQAAVRVIGKQLNFSAAPAE
jgi:hypothetical protein